MVRLRRRGAGAHERAPPRYVLPPPEIADTRRLLAASRQSRAAAPKKSPSAAHEHHEPTRALREPTDAPGASKGCAPLSTSWKPDAARHALSSRYLEVRATDGKFASRLAAVALGSLLDHPLARIPEGHGQPPPGRHPEPVSSRGVTAVSPAGPPPSPSGRSAPSTFHHLAWAPGRSCPRCRRRRPTDEPTDRRAGDPRVLEHTVPSDKGVRDLGGHLQPVGYPSNGVYS